MFTREMALRALDRRAHSRAELTALLIRKGADEEIVEQVLDRLTELGLVNDLEFARQWVESRHRVRGLPANTLRMELRRKGIAPEIIEEAVSAVGRDAEYQAALNLARVKARGAASDDRDKALRRLVGMLGRRGFSPEISWECARRALDGDD